MQERRATGRRLTTAASLALALGFAAWLHAHPGWLEQRTIGARAMNWAYGLSLLFLLLGSPAWLLLGSAGTVADARERRALRVDAAFVLGAFVVVLLLVLAVAVSS